uniref:Uncharacterized protein n=1 Tax=Cacopsylla melanoneura TaxID=428564 RepID=A0A8D8ZXR8_9HEMI
MINTNINNISTINTSKTNTIPTLLTGTTTTNKTMDTFITTMQTSISRMRECMLSNRQDMLRIIITMWLKQIRHIIKTSGIIIQLVRLELIKKIRRLMNKFKILL